MTKEQIKKLITDKPDKMLITMAIQNHWKIQKKYWKPYKDE